MFLKSSFPVPTPSGFVAFDGGGAVEADAERVAEETLRVAAATARPAPRQASAAPVAAPAGLRQSPVWSPAGRTLARSIEGTVIAAICGYFGIGFASLLGWI